MREKNLTYFQAIRSVLQRSQRPLSIMEVEREILGRQLRNSIVSSGLRSVLYKDIDKGDLSTFIKNEDGLYLIRKPENKFEDRKEKKRIDKNDGGKVLVFDTNQLQKYGYFRGIRSESSIYVSNLLHVDTPNFIPRSQAEDTDVYKQIVSYVIVKYKNQLLRFTRHITKRNKFLNYLDGKYSIGFGGHVQEEDLLFSKTSDSGYGASVEREIYEESLINLDNVKSEQIIGVLNDDSTPRGKCHFAFLHLFELATPSFKDNDKYVKNLKLVSFQEISDDLANYEWWSRLCLQYYFPTNLTVKCFIDTRNNFKLRNNYKCLAVVGEIGSGKSKVSSILTERYGYIHVPCSKILKEIISSKLICTTDRREVQNVGYDFINSPDAHDVFAERLYSYIQSINPNYRFVLDGLRYPETLVKLQEKIGRIIPVIYVETNKLMQYENYKLRENPSASFEDFEHILGHPVESHIQRFVPHSRVIILNQSTLDSLGDAVKKYFDDEFAGSDLQITWDINARYRHEQILRGNDLTFAEVFVPHFLNQIEEIRDHSYSKVLDIGCGTGILTDIISNHVRSVVGIDYSYDSINIAKTYSKKENVNFECISVEDYQNSSQFDFAIANMTFHTVENIQRALKNIYRLLKPGGRLIFTLPHPRYYPLRDRVKKIFLENNYKYEKESFHKIPFTISKEPDPLPGLTPYFHRPIHYYENALYKAGFMLLDTKIPFPKYEILSLYPDRWTLPHILLCVAMKTF